MKLITLDQARVHVKSDGDDDELLTVYCNAAESICARLANRNLYAATADLTAAVDGVAATMTAAYETYDAAILVANDATDTRMRDYLTLAAEQALRAATTRADAVLHGLALDAAPDLNGTPGNDAIISAILLTVGHLYRNREAVISGQGSAAVEVPLTVQDIMSHFRWIGPHQ